MNHIQAHYAPSPADDWRHSYAYRLVLTLPNGSEKHGPVIYAASQPSEADARRTARRLRRYWRVSTAIQERKVA